MKSGGPLKRALVWYLIFTMGITVLLDGVRVLAFRESNVRYLLSFLTVWVPGGTALCVVRKYLGGRLFFSFRSCGVDKLLLGCVIPVVYLLASYGIYWLCVPNSYRGSAFLANRIRTTFGLRLSDGAVIFIFFITGTLIGMVSAAGEEIGWRGFLYPALEKLCGRWTALLAGGAVWSAWHMPLIVGRVYLTAAPLWYVIPIFTVVITGMGIILAWLCAVSESLWPAVILHAVHNMLDTMIFRTVTDHTGSAFFTGEQGALTAAAVVSMAVAALVLWNRRDKFRKLNGGKWEQKKKKN